MHAVSRDWHTDIASFFIEHGAIIDKADKYGRTPLHLAASVDHYHMVEFLILNGGITSKLCCFNPIICNSQNSASNCLLLERLIMNQKLLPNRPWKFSTLIQDIQVDPIEILLFIYSEGTTKADLRFQYDRISVLSLEDITTITLSTNL